MNKILIRVDANSIIGTGHIMRCMSIAEELRNNGADVTFIMSDKENSDILHEYKFNCIYLNSRWDNLDGEIDQLIDICKNADVLLIDSYFVTKHYLCALKKYIKIAYMDDLNSFDYPVNMLINYNIYGENFSYSKLIDKLLIGCKYVPLRTEFRQISRNCPEKINNLLITTGGTDELNVVDKILEKYTYYNRYSELDIFCVIGKFNINKDMLMAKYCHNKKIHFLYNIKNMKDYMIRCDLCITAGGITVYELCACGIPAITFSLADNQLSMVKKMDEIGLMPWAGDVRENINSCICNIFKLVELYFDKDKWIKTSRAMRDIVDGNGAARIANEIIKLNK